MSQMGHSRRSDRAPMTSGVPPIDRHSQCPSAGLKGANTGRRICALGFRSCKFKCLLLILPLFERTIEVIRVSAQLEGMITDPVHEGKSMHG